jgi:hypothetical protein
MHYVPALHGVKYGAEAAYFCFCLRSHAVSQTNEKEEPSSKGKVTANLVLYVGRNRLVYWLLPCTYNKYS